LRVDFSILGTKQCTGRIEQLAQNPLRGQFMVVSGEIRSDLWQG